VIGRRTLIELAFVAAGLGVALWLTVHCARSYPMGAQVIWWCGTAAMLSTLLLAIGPVRRALAADRAARDTGAFRRYRA